ncbi:MAG TPA: hypothetical protein VI584_02190 [Nitrospiria bacterium]|nr:hypothetical protein [Nitrospiria bacterium]
MRQQEGKPETGPVISHADESEDLPAAIVEAMKRQRLEVVGLRREGVKSPMPGLVERAIEQLVKRD